LENPTKENPTKEKPETENPTTENPTINKEVNTNKEIVINNNISKEIQQS